ncbi:nucleotidyltransferase domain-containing protein [Lentzea sp. BCCO 10_0856]|uniref:Nucleotidyltransferase domain-containing protein n=1 Tax=Lentzea miocenica TaxID=3095431 RepID=A0ABU4TFG2_9PSEU|nr:nucleotidyltransferase domain-containing protein [Lentzea sp. BCCO 10_0856]MDX8036612.1 nucleotidyltransferase domain-containing protein [Lentzea sp. BCCO 10_0856]
MSYEVPDLSAVVAEQSHGLLFATVSGAHLYGFPSRDSDVDLRGVHVLPLAEIVGLRHGPETKERMWVRDGVEIDLVTHDVQKFCRLLTRPNGYVLEQLLSPLVVHTTDGHRKLADLAAGCLTSRHGHHYRGFAATQWRLFERTGEIKPLLYTFRALLTGVHLLRTGEVLAHLPTLLDKLDGPDYLTALIEAKILGEHRALAGVPERPAPERLEADLAHWQEQLREARETTDLPEHPPAFEAVHEFVVATRLG